MNTRGAIVVGCRLLAVWMGAEAARTALNGYYFAGQLKASSLEGGSFDPMRGYWFSLSVTFLIVLLLWFFAPFISRAGSTSGEEHKPNFDTSRALLRVLAAYLLVAAVNGLADFFLKTRQREMNVAITVTDQIELAQSLVSLVAGILLFVGADRLKRVISGVARFGMEESEAH